MGNFSKYNSYEKKKTWKVLLSIYLFIYLFIQETIPDLLIIVFFCRSNEQLKGKLRHECSTEVTTEECILYFLHHKNGRLALESTRKPKVCPDKCHLGRISSELSPRTFYRPDLLPLGLRGWGLVEAIGSLLLIKNIAFSQFFDSRTVQSFSWFYYLKI